jgi:hypothetical protein
MAWSCMITEGVQKADAGTARAADLMGGPTDWTTKARSVTNTTTKRESPWENNSFMDRHRQLLLVPMVTVGGHFTHGGTGTDVLRS